MIHKKMAVYVFLPLKQADLTASAANSACEYSRISV
jgi:hypothetical protein